MDRWMKKAMVVGCCLVLAAVVCVISWVEQNRNLATGGHVDDGTPLPVIMYHHTLKNTPEALGKFTISPSEFESDLDYLQHHGYQTIVVQDLLDYYDKGTPLPPKPVMITFDDGYESGYAYIYPILKQRKEKMVLSVIGSLADEYSGTENKSLNYSYATWEQLREMSESGVVEVQNHSYHLHDNEGVGASKRSFESKEEYQKRLMEDLDKNKQRIVDFVGKEPTAFTFPFGSASQTAGEIIWKMGYRVTLGCEEGVNWITADEQESIRKLRRFNRPSGISSEAFFSRFLPD